MGVMHLLQTLLQVCYSGCHIPPMTLVNDAVFIMTTYIGNDDVDVGY